MGVIVRIGNKNVRMPGVVEPGVRMVPEPPEEELAPDVAPEEEGNEKGQDDSEEEERTGPGYRP